MPRTLKALGAAVAALACVMGAPTGGAHLLASMQAAAPSGILLYLNRGDIWQLNLASKAQMLLIHPPAGIVTRLAHSPDRRQIAYSVLYLDQMYHILGGDIVVADADGSNQQTVVHEDEVGYSVG